MMKTYHLYVFTQDACAPCTRLKDYVQSLTADEQAELDFVPLKTAYGDRTALATELNVSSRQRLSSVTKQSNANLTKTAMNSVTLKKKR